MIFMIRQGVYHYGCYLQRRAIQYLWMFATKYLVHNPRYKIKNQWCPVDIHFQDSPGSLPVLFRHLKEASTSFADIATNCHLDYPRCNANNHWQSVDAYSQNGAVSVSLSLSLIEAANTLVMHNSNHVNFRLPCLFDQTLIMVSWRSF